MEQRKLKRIPVRLEAHILVNNHSSAAHIIKIPGQRLPLTEYYDPDPSVPDKTYGSRAAVFDGFEFDWIKRGIPQTVVESTDIAHWLALEVALKAVTDAGYTNKNVPSDRTGVVLGNTLTGEHSRSENMRLRWPYVRRILSNITPTHDKTSISLGSRQAEPL